MKYKNSASTIDGVGMIAFANKIDSEEIISKTDAIKIGIIEKGKTKSHLLLRSVINSQMSLRLVIGSQMSLRLVKK